MENHDTTELTLNIASALENAKTFKVTDDETRLKASESRKQVKQWEKAVEAAYGPKKEELYRPYKELLDEIKSLTDTLKSLDGIFKKGIEEYDREVERKRQEAIRAEQKRLDNLRKKAEEKGEPVPVVEVEAAVSAPIERPKAAGEYQVEVWSIEVVDFKLLPDEYKLADTSKLNGVVKAMKSLTNIPGTKVSSHKDVRQRA